MALLFRISRITPILLLIPRLAAAEEVIHHQLRVTLMPESGQIQASDTITLPPLPAPLHFSLRAGLSPSSPDPAVQITADPKASPEPDVKTYRLILPAGRSEFTVNYQGKPVPAMERISGGSSRDPQGTSNYISPENVYLDGSSAWYPQFGDALVTFSVTAEMPPAWQAVSQGRPTRHRENTMTWEETRPQEEIFLLAAPYHDYHQAAGAIDTAVWLRGADPELAKQYLSVIAGYVDMYSRLLGPYPYDKFAVVENNWESGYGMPSFTLLGPKVMRLPFILRSSLPHEILHNWWGNGVYVDYRQGNWSEGLTAYLADHLLREQAGEGAAYRRNALLRYTNYVSEGNDFPLQEFQGRHGEASQAVGYDKALMVFHMLRLQLGDQGFIAALRNFQRERQFHRASWDELRRAFEAVGHRPLQAEFAQWLQRRGAPALQWQGARAQRRGDHYELTAEIAQTQAGPAYHLHIPVAVQLGGQDQAWQTEIDMAHKQQTIHLQLPARPWRVAADPEFDVFRRLDPGELPPTLSEAFGARSLLMVLPSAASPALRAAYQQLAHTLAEAGSGIEVRWDKDVPRLPKKRAVWLLGWENRFIPSPLGRGWPVGPGEGTNNGTTAWQSLAATHGKVSIEGQILRRDEHAVVLTARRNGTAMVWLGCDNPAAFPGLARKLPHYGSYSYLAFQGDEPTNIGKGQWQVFDSPLNIAVQQTDSAAPPDQPLRLRPRAALIKE